MNSDGFTVVTVTLSDREDGGLRVHSDDLPGLILSGPNKHVICEMIAPAIQALFGARGEDVIVHTPRPLADILKLASPRDVDMHVQQFVIELKRAA